jgi:hypothetical protein
MTQRMRASVTAMLYIQKPNIITNIAVTIVPAIVGAAVMLTEAPWCNVFHHRTEK